MYRVPSCHTNVTDACFRSQTRWRPSPPCAGSVVCPQVLFEVSRILMNTPRQSDKGRYSLPLNGVASLLRNTAVLISIDCGYSVNRKVFREPRTWMGGVDDRLLFFVRGREQVLFVTESNWIGEAFCVIDPAKATINIRPEAYLTAPCRSRLKNLPLSAQRLRAWI